MELYKSDERGVQPNFDLYSLSCIPETTQSYRTFEIFADISMSCFVFTYLKLS